MPTDPSSTPLDKNLNIGIIGAGAAGLSTWYYLKQQGYTRITVLEKSAEPGGMCRTMEHNGHHFDLATGNFLNTLSTSLRGVSLVDFGSAILRYLWNVWRYRKAIAAPTADPTIKPLNEMQIE